MGGPIQIVCRRCRWLPACLSALHRTESRQGKYGCYTCGLAVVELHAMPLANPLLYGQRMISTLGLGRMKKERLSACRALFHAHIDEAMMNAIRSSTNKGLALGSNRYKTQVEALTGRRVTPQKRGPGKAAEKEGWDRGDRSFTLTPNRHMTSRQSVASTGLNRRQKQTFTGFPRYVSVSPPCRNRYFLKYSSPPHTERLADGNPANCWL